MPMHRFKKSLQDSVQPLQLATGWNLERAKKYANEHPMATSIRIAVWNPSLVCARARCGKRQPAAPTAEGAPTAEEEEAPAAAEEEAPAAE